MPPEALGRERQEDQEVNSNLGSTANWRSVGLHKNKNKQRKERDKRGGNVGF